jgi:PAS domain S-box-containing protein
MREKRLLAAFAVLLALLVGVVAVGYLSFAAMARANRASLHTYAVLRESEGMLEGLVDMETAFRGFGLTGDGEQVQAWAAARRDFAAHREAARRLTRDHPLQQRRLRTMDTLSARWVAMQLSTGFSKAATEPERESARREVAAGSRLGRRSAVMRQMRGVVGAMVRTELDLLNERGTRAERLERRTMLLLGTGGAFGVMLAAGLALMVTRRSRGLSAANAALAEEIGERRLAQRAAEHLARQNELILGSADEGICGVDVHGYVTFVNPAAGRMLGRDPADAIGRPVEAVLAVEGEGAAGFLLSPVRETLRRGETERVAAGRMRRVDGADFPVELVSAPVLQEGRIGGAVVTFRDVSERREVERMKDEFVAVVSHELRTPLTSLRGSLGLLAAGRAGPMPERGLRLVQIAVQNTDRLVRLINDILDLERLRAGKQAVEPGMSGAGELMRGAADVMEAMAERAGVRLLVSAAEVRVRADADRILQVLTNLVSNAVKFSPPGSAVSLSAAARDGEVLFSVRDHGRGVPSDKLELIFERFQQVDSSDARQKGGTGLGLAICRSIVEQHGGRIWAESDGKGSAFHFTLPLVPDAAPSDEVPALTGAG